MKIYSRSDSECTISNEMTEPSVWGPPFWTTLHYIAMGYPSTPTVAVQASYRSFFESLDAVIPCNVCSSNYRAHLRDHPVAGYLDSPDRLFRWTVDIHNVVNREHGKRVWTVREAREVLLPRDTSSSSSTFSGSPSPAFVLGLVFLATSLVAIFFCVGLLGSRGGWVGTPHR